MVPTSRWVIIIRTSFSVGFFCVYTNIPIEDVERGAELELSFSASGIVKFCFQTTKFWFQTDGRTDGRTDARNIFWAFLVKN